MTTPGSLATTSHPSATSALSTAPASTPRPLAECRPSPVTNSTPPTPPSDRPLARPRPAPRARVSPSASHQPRARDGDAPRVRGRHPVEVHEGEPVAVAAAPPPRRALPRLLLDERVDLGRRGPRAALPLGALAPRDGLVGRVRLRRRGGAEPQRGVPRGDAEGGAAEGARGLGLAAAAGAARDALPALVGGEAVDGAGRRRRALGGVVLGEPDLGEEGVHGGLEAAVFPGGGGQRGGDGGGGERREYGVEVRGGGVGVV